jgi:hypothetical protein
LGSGLSKLLPSMEEINFIFQYLLWTVTLKRSILYNPSHK